MKNLEIIRATLSQIDELQEIGIQTFTESFSSQNSEEDMSDYLEIAFSRSRLETELTNPNSEFYFASLEGEVIGYLKLNFGRAQTDIQEENGMEIERIYILGKYQRKNVGQMLHTHALSIAHKKNIDYIWLGVWEENPKAIGFYKKNGFVAFGNHQFMVGNDEQTDILMKLKLK